MIEDTDITSAVDNLIGDYAIKDHNVMVWAHYMLSSQLIGSYSYRGCKFHFLQSPQKVTILVTKTQSEELIFIHLAKKIPDCESKEHVQLVFR